MATDQLYHRWRNVPRPLIDAKHSNGWRTIMARSQRLVVRGLSRRNTLGSLDVRALAPCRAHSAEVAAAPLSGRATARRPSVAGPSWTVRYRPDRRRRPRTGLPIRVIRPADGWCDAPADRNYNRAVRFPYPGQHRAHVARRPALRSRPRARPQHAPAHPRRRQRDLRARGPAGLPADGRLRGADPAPLARLLAHLEPGARIIVT